MRVSRSGSGYVSGHYRTRDHALLEAERHSNVVALASQALALWVGFVVIDDVADHYRRIAVLASPARDGPALFGELCADL